MPQFQLMLQKLLADRFHLELHRESRLSSVYEMTVAKSGLKMTPVPLPTTPVTSGAAQRAPITGLFWTTAGKRIQTHGHVATIRQILIWLNDVTKRDIVDRTGLTEAYDFEASWTISDEADDPFDADILDSALEKDLGLKVASRKVPVEMLISDRLDRVPVLN
jgi:uncharacterized protein (TIGR03435 family)